MQSSGYIKLQGRVDVDEFFMGGFEEGKVGRSKGRKKQVVMGIEMKKELFVVMHSKLKMVAVSS